jgi:heme/copper-type cytochrome/quinol oxidase subunit 4
VSEPLQPLRSEDWFGKAAAGLVCGFTLAIALTGLFAWLGPGGLLHSSARTQLAMWLVAPIWVTVLSTCFLFRSAARAWGWLLAANAVCFGLLYAVRALVQ